MAILSNRSIKTLLDESIGWLSSEQALKIIGRLNRSPAPEALATEWELIVLSALALLGSAKYEPDLGGSGVVDFEFESSSSGLKLVGDVTSVSDDKPRTDSVDALVDALDEQFRKRGLRVSSHLEIGTYEDELGEVGVCLPKPHEFSRYIFNKDFLVFLDAVRCGPEETRTFELNNAHARLKFICGPGPWQRLVSYRELCAPRDVRRNVIYRRLRRKSSQINSSGHPPGDGLRVVVLCDGCSSALHSRKSHEIVDLSGITKAFFRAHESIDLVLAISVNEDLGAISPNRNMYFSVRGFDRHESGIGYHVAKILEQALRRLATPKRNPLNARCYLELLRKNGFEAFSSRSYSGSTLAQSYQDFSMRAITDLMTGKVDRERFNSVLNAQMLEVFCNRFLKGERLTKVELIPKEYEDDDVIRFHFGGFDAATTEFRRPDPL